MESLLKNESIQEDWIKEILKQLDDHHAWYGLLSKEESEKLLNNHSPFTYLLRMGNDPFNFILSYIEKDKTVLHKTIKLDLNSREWFYRNGGPCISRFSSDLNELIPMVMHCSISECIGLKKDKVF